MIPLLMPHLPIIAYLLVLLFITLYAVLSSIEFGAAVYMALSEPIVDRKMIEHYFGPAWEATNVFLIFSVVGLVMFFPASVPLLAQLYTLVSLALLFLVVRVLGILGIFYADSSEKIFAYLFAAGSLSAPLALSGVFYFAFTGMPPTLPPSTLLWALWGTVLGAIFMLSAPFVTHVISRRAKVAIERLRGIQIVWSGVFLVASWGVLSFRPGSLAGGPLPVLLLLGIILFVAAAIAATERKYPLRSFLLNAFAVATLIFGTALSHLPFLLYPTLRLEEAFTAPEMFLAMLSVVPFGLIVAVPAVALLWHLFARKG